MKNIFIEIKISLNVLHSSLDTAVERMSKLDSISEEMNQTAAQRERRGWKIWKCGLWMDVEDETRRCGACSIRVLEGENREN